MNQPMTGFLVGLSVLCSLVVPTEVLGQAETKAAVAPTEAKQAAAAQSKADAGSETPEHAELRKVREGVIKAVDERDIDALLSFLHPNVVVVWQNGETSRGHDGVRAYYDRMMTGDKRVVESLKSNAKVAERSIVFGGDTAIARGTLQDDFKLRDGMEFHLVSYWTATLVKENGRWLIASYHASNNVFDNEVQNLVVKKVATWVGLGAGVAGLVIGLVVARMLRKRPQPA